MKNEAVITIHASKDIHPETLKALGEMMTALIAQLDKQEKEKQNENIRTKREGQQKP